MSKKLYQHIDEAYFSLPPAMLQAPIGYLSIRLACMGLLAERLAELDMSEPARWERAFKVQVQLGPAFHVPTSLYYVHGSLAKRKQTAGRVSIGGKFIGFAQPIGDPTANSNYQSMRAGYTSPDYNLDMQTRIRLAAPPIDPKLLWEMFHNSI